MKGQVMGGAQPIWRSWMRALMISMAFVGLVAAEDPRPSILVFGDYQSLPHKGCATWVQHLQEAHPEWRIQVDATAKRSIGPGLRAEMDAALDKAGTISQLIVFVGHEIAKSTTTPEEVDQVASSVQDAIAALRTAERRAAFDVVVVTTLHVHADGLDRWSSSLFTAPDERSRLVAAAWQEASAAHDVPCVAIDDGEVLAGTGWLLGAGGHERLAGLMATMLESHPPRAIDAEEFTHWQDVQAWHDRIDRALAATSEGTVAIGAALPVQSPPPPPDPSTLTERERKRLKRFGPKPDPRRRIAIPADQLVSGALTLLIRPEDGHLAVLASTNAVFGAHPVLELVYPDDTVTIRPAAGDARIIDEGNPDTVASNGRFGVNSGKWRPLAVLSGVSGQRRWLVLRIPLPTDREAPPQQATLVLQEHGDLAQLQQLVDGAPGAYTPEATLGTWAIHPITGRDRLCRPTRLTWSTRDGHRPWTGGAVSVTERTRRLSALQQEDPPQAIRKRIEHHLDTDVAP